MSDRGRPVLGLLAARLDGPARQQLAEAVPAALASAVAAARGRDAGEGPGDGAAGSSASDLTGALCAALGLVLMAAPPERAGSLLRALSPEMRLTALTWLVNATALSLRRGHGAAEAAELEALRAALDWGRAWPLEQVAAMVRQAARGEDLREILMALRERDEPAAAALRDHLFGFEDLGQLSDAELQHVLGRVDNATLALSMAGSSETLAQRLLSNISDRRAALVRDDAELYAEAEPLEVERARGRLLSTARHLYESGMVSVYLGSVSQLRPGPGEGDPAEDSEAGDGAGKAGQPGEAGPAADAGQPPPRRAWDRGLGLGLGLAVGAAALTAAGLLALLEVEPAGPGSSGTVGAAGRRSPSAAAPRVAIQRSTAEDTGTPDGSAAAPAPGALDPGQVYRTGQVEAVLQFPGRESDSAVTARAATVEVAASTEVSRPEPSSAEAAGPDSTATGTGDLYLRLGRVRVTVTGTCFAVQTPVVRAEGQAGAVYRVRTALDGTTEVRVERGPVDLSAPGAGSVAARLESGDGRRVRAGR